MIKLSNDYLNDYIAPSNACIKPQLPSTKKETLSSSEYEVQRADKIESTSIQQAVNISLSDCLACSGCITSSESVLISTQNYTEFLTHISSNKLRYLIVSISPQSRASFASKYNISMDSVVQTLRYFFDKLVRDRFVEQSQTIVKLFDTSFSRDISLLQMQKEFEERHDGRPLITSACPGWICYAEKTHGDWILPYISRVKSPQQIMASIVREVFGREGVYHLSIMPCFDKKLEASRIEFDGDINCVLSSIEVETMMMEAFGKGFMDIDTMENKYDGELAKVDAVTGMILGTEGSSSGGYLEYTMQQTLRKLTLEHGQELVRVETVPGRNADYTTYKVYVGDNVESVFVRAYGFRNIQNIVRQLKTKRNKANFIELMACPQGCINGGGQLKPMDSKLPSDLKAFVIKSDKVYASIPTRDPSNVEYNLKDDLLYCTYNDSSSNLNNDNNNISIDY